MHSLQTSTKLCKAYIPTQLEPTKISKHDAIKRQYKLLKTTSTYDVTLQKVCGKVQAHWNVGLVQQKD